MPRITKITTRRGDDGLTDLIGGERVRKDSKRIHAIGALDELSSALGMARASRPQPETDGRLLAIQNDLLCIGAMLSRTSRRARVSPGPALDSLAPEALEQESAALQRRLGPLENFLLPGGTPAAAALQFARAVCRRAEREVVALSRSASIDPLARIYLNRLSDLLFQYARLENHAGGDLRTTLDRPLKISRSFLYFIISHKRSSDPAHPGLNQIFSGRKPIPSGSLVCEFPVNKIGRLFLSSSRRRRKDGCIGDVILAGLRGIDHAVQDGKQRATDQEGDQRET